MELFVALKTEAQAARLKGSVLISSSQTMLPNV